MDSLSPAEALSAIYIDFEGNEDMPPSLLGVRWRARGHDHFEQFVIEQALFPAVTGSSKTDHGWPLGYSRVEAVPADRVSVARATDTLASLVARLVTSAESEDRLLVSWSRHERDVIVAALDGNEDLRSRFVAVWRDGKVTAKQWKRRTHPSVKFERIIGSGTHRLDEYFKLIHYKVPLHLGNQKAAARITHVRAQLQKRESYARLTTVAKAKWTKLLDYNWHDCNGLREVVITAASANP